MTGKYNGWSNYETYCVGSWLLNNDEKEYNHLRNQIVPTKFDDDNIPVYSFNNVKELEVIVKDYIVDKLETCDIKYGLFKDIMRMVINEINFYEIAASLLDYEN